MGIGKVSWAGGVARSGMGMGMGVGVDSPREAAESTDTFVVDMHLHT